MFVIQQKKYKKSKDAWLSRLCLYTYYTCVIRHWYLPLHSVLIEIQFIYTNLQFSYLLVAGSDSFWSGQSSIYVDWLSSFWTVINTIYFIILHISRLISNDHRFHLQAIYKQQKLSNYLQKISKRMQIKYSNYLVTLAYYLLDVIFF